MNRSATSWLAVALLALVGVGVAQTGEASAQTGAASAQATAPWVSSRTPARVDYVDNQHHRWTASPSSYTGGTLSTMTAPVDNTSNPRLFQKMRIGVTAFQAAVPAPGTYSVDLMMVEPTNTTVGKRVFSISAEGVNKVSNLDLVAEGGVKKGVFGASRHGVVHSFFTVPVTDGTLNIAFTPTVGQTVLGAVNIGQLSANTALAPTFVDNFNGPAGASVDPSLWGVEVKTTSASEQQAYTTRPENVEQDGSGHLLLTEHKESYTNQDGQTYPYTSGRITTGGLHSFQYGQISIRAKWPAGQALWPAFWMVGDDINTKGWPASGEVDILEALGQLPNTPAGVLHGPWVWSSYGYDLVSWYNSATRMTDDLHTYSLLWTPIGMQWSIDGHPFATRVPTDLPAGGTWVFDKPFYLILNLGVGGPVGWAGPPTAATPSEAQMVVDYVKVEQ